MMRKIQKNTQKTGKFEDQFFDIANKMRYYKGGKGHKIE